MDNLTGAIDKRISRRKYIDTPLKESDVAELTALIEDFSSKENIKMQLVLDNGDAFNGFNKSYGMFSGVKNYIVLIGNPNDLVQQEKFGYFGEMLVLRATAMGLGTCWVGGTFDKASCPVKLDDGESIVCAITVGNVSETLGAKEKLIHWGIRRKTKAAEEMFVSDGDVPSWFLSGMSAVQKAPSAVNRQPVMFSYKNGTVTASVEDISKGLLAIDLGIAKLHFELGAGGGKWLFGNGAAFERQ